jgi:hypothetical protein
VVVLLKKLAQERHETLGDDLDDQKSANTKVTKKKASVCSKMQTTLPAVFNA